MIAHPHRHKIPQFRFRSGKLNIPGANIFTTPLDVLRRIREDEKTHLIIELVDCLPNVLKPHWSAVSYVFSFQRFMSVCQISASYMQRDYLSIPSPDRIDRVLRGGTDGFV